MKKTVVSQLFGYGYEFSGCWSTLVREVHALQDAETVWPLADLQLITLGQLTQNLLPGVKVHQAADWLLSTEPGLGSDSL